MPFGRSESIDSTPGARPAAAATTAAASPGRAGVCFAPSPSASSPNAVARFTAPSTTAPRAPSNASASAPDARRASFRASASSSLGTSNHGHTSRISHANATASFCANPFSGSSTSSTLLNCNTCVFHVFVHTAPSFHCVRSGCFWFNTATRYRTQ